MDNCYLFLTEDITVQLQKSVCRFLRFLEAIMDELVRRARENISYTYFPGISMTDVKDAPTSFPEHWHLSAEFILARKNDCLFNINGEEYLLQEGDLLLIWPAQLHQTVRTPVDGHIILQFSAEMLASCDDLNDHYRLLQKLHLFQADSSDACKYLGRKMEECLDLYMRMETFSETKIRLRIYEMLLYLCETQLPDASAAPAASAKNRDTFLRMQKVCNFIRQNCRENISQKDAADISGFSKYYFSRIFREYTQESFSEYLTRQRIQHAMTLLSQDDIPITDVAYLSGFQSLSNFSKVFRNTMNCSPMQYRKKHRIPARGTQ